MTLIAFFLGFACCAALVSHDLQITRGSRRIRNMDRKGNGCHDGIPRSQEDRFRRILAWFVVTLARPQARKPTGDHLGG